MVGMYRVWVSSVGRGECKVCFEEARLSIEEGFVL